MEKQMTFADINENWENTIIGCTFDEESGIISPINENVCTEERGRSGPSSD